MNPSAPSITESIVTITRKSKSEFLSFQSTNEFGAQPDYSNFLIGEKGYRTALSNHGFIDGCFFFEVEMLTPLIPLPFVGVQPALRIGFVCQEDQDLELPIGSNERSYCYASTGKIISNSKAAKELNETFAQKDVIGALMFLHPPKPEFLRKQEEDVHEISTGSYIHFYKNGVKQAQGFDKIYEGKYYAAISLYMQAQCKVNFGESPFKYPPPINKKLSKQEQWRPYSDIIASVGKKQ